MPEHPDPRPMLDRALAQTEDIIAAVTTGQLANPTPCPAYDVRGLIAHLVVGLERGAATVEGRGVGKLDVPVPPAEAWGALFHGAGLHAKQAWGAVNLTVMVDSPWGTVAAGAAVAGSVVEVVAHGWDLARATGQPTDRDPEVGELALAVAQHFVPGTGRRHGASCMSSRIPRCGHCS